MFTRWRFVFVLAQTQNNHSVGIFFCRSPKDMLQKVVYDEITVSRWRKRQTDWDSTRSEQEPQDLVFLMPRKSKPVEVHVRDLHMDFVRHLEYKEKPLIELFCDCRTWVLELFPECNELLYHTHALTSVFSISDRLGDAFCMIPIYSNHFNLGFNQGTRLKDPHGLMTGTGKLIRHIDIKSSADYRNPRVKALLKSAADLAVKEMKKPTNCIGQTISKIAKIR